MELSRKARLIVISVGVVVAVSPVLPGQAQIVTGSGTTGTIPIFTVPTRNSTVKASVDW